MGIYNVPWRLVQNKLVRYPGGREIDKFRGINPGEDDGRPEAWIGSDTRVCNVGPDDPNEGCQECILPDGRRMYLFEAVAENPEGVLGKKHMEINGTSMAVLVKLLDAEKQLDLQSHPDRDFAKKYFNSDYGKAECWYIIGKRDDVPEPPYVLMGFKEGVTREVFAKHYYNEDLPSMEACCHKVPVEIGDCFNIEAGVPHAVGAGCFVVEVQEPSDVTAFTWKLKDGTDEEKAFHDEQQLGCYHYEGHSYEDNLKIRLIPPVTIREGDWGTEKIVLGTRNTPYFSFTRIDASGEVPVTKTGFPQVCICLSGDCRLVYEGGEMEIKKADEFFFPANIGDIKIVPGEEGVSMVLCHPQGYVCE
ncbi:hypothetical protein [Anaerolentibacter hominis]|uniref:class I mannose-6-phosphate isomerase n=1 Tax=Anaerolentibacter hominis TaxID=3079009 RepID=UPI0031B8687A